MYILDNFQNQIRGFVKQKWKIQTGTDFNSFQNQQPDNFSPYELVGTSVAYKVGTYCLKPC
jgi:hypothetical protein